MLVTLNSRSTITLPNEIRKPLGLQPGDPLELVVQDGTIRITPVAVVPRRVALTDKGEEKEREASAEVERGSIKTFSTAQALIEDLNEDRED